MSSDGTKTISSWNRIVVSQGSQNRYRRHQRQRRLLRSISSTNSGQSSVAPPAVPRNQRFKLDRSRPQLPCQEVLAVPVNVTHRTVETCIYRGTVRNSGHSSEVARCGLLQDITGVEDVSLLDASRRACDVCVQKHAPTTEQINSVIASLLFGVTKSVIESGGIDGCDFEKAKQLQSLARKNLEVIMRPLSSDAARPANGDAPCFYFGQQIGEQKCAGCRGSVRQKTFACLHEAHGETTVRRCRQCRDYDEKLICGGIRHWCAGLTTSPRAEPTLERSLRSLEKAGWPKAHVFAEPLVDLPSWLMPHRRTIRAQKLGAWPNWFLSLNEMYLREPHADAYLICQDDVLYCQGLREYLEKTLWPSHRLGVVSLHTASHQDRGDAHGFYTAQHGWGAWGAQAYVLPNPSVRALLRNGHVVNHRNRGPGAGMQNVDSVVGQWCKDTGLDYYLHTPSLAQHIGDTSTLWKDASATGRRRAATFVGEEANIREAILST